MNTLKYISVIMVAAAVIVAAIAIPRSCSKMEMRGATTVTDTIRRDTTIYNVRTVDSTVVRYVYRTITVTDTVTKDGTLLVKIPVSSYRFDLPKLGTIYASGYDVSIDSTTFTTTTIVTKPKERKVKFNMKVGGEVAYSWKFTPSVYAECGITVKGRFSVYTGMSVFYDNIVNGGVYAGMRYIIR